MPTSSPPTFAQATAKWSAEINRLQKARLFANANATPQGNLVDLDRTAQQAGVVDASDSAGLENARTTLRQSLAAILGSAASVLLYVMHQLGTCSVIASGAQTFVDLLGDIYLYFAANNQRLTSRLFNRGQFVAGSPCLGNGVWRRCWVDSYGFPLEASFADVYKLKCVQDSNLGVLVNNEVWRLRPLPFIDNLEWGVSGRGRGQDIFCKTMSSDDTVLNNASFSDRTGSDAVPTAISFWTSNIAVVGDGSDYQIDRTNFYYLGQKESGSAGSLRIYLTRTISQALSVANIPLSLNTPYYPALMVNPTPGSYVGVVQFSWGSQSVSATVNGAALTAALSATAGAVTTGTHSYVVTFVVNGIESGYGPKSNVVTADGSHKVDLTNIPLGPAGTTARKIYRTVAGDTGSYKLAITIADNVTTTQTGASGDNVVDGSLGAVVGTLNHGTWFRLEPATLGSNVWPRNFQQQGGNSVSVTATKTSGAGTWVNIDAVQFFAFYAHAGTFAVPIAGSLAWVNEDVGTITDTEQGAAPTTGQAAGILQDWNHRGGVGSFPSCPPSPVAANCTGGVAAPTLAQSATAGVVTAGAHLVGVTFVDQNGNESGISVLSNSITFSDSLHAADFTTIPTFLGNTGSIVARKLYMNKAGTGSGGTFYYTGITLNDNSTTSATGASGISVADATLGTGTFVAAPVGVTVVDPA